MLLIDDILLSPLHGFLWITRKVHDAAQQESATEAEDITTKLADLYMMLETGRISESEFEVAERNLLDHLDKLQERRWPMVSAP